MCNEFYEVEEDIESYESDADEADDTPLQSPATDAWIKCEATAALSMAKLLFPTKRELAPYASNPGYLASTRWRELRSRVIRAASGRCTKCNISSFRCRERYGCGLDVHHLTYERFGNERDDDLSVLCRRCHLEAECAKLQHVMFIPACHPGWVRCVCGNYVGIKSAAGDRA